MTSKKNRYYVEAITKRGELVAYGVYDNIAGMVARHATYDVNEKQSADVAAYLASQHRDDLNSEIA